MSYEGFMTSKSSKSVSRKGQDESTYGLHPRAFSASVAGFVDQDYIHKLSPKDQKWLADFNEHYYEANFKREGGGVWTDPDRKAAYIRKNKANFDAFHMVHGIRKDTVYINQPNSGTKDAEVTSDHVRGGDIEIPDRPDRDYTPAPAYLSTPQYKDALRAFRSNLVQKGRPAAPPITPDFIAAKQALQAIIPAKSTLTQKIDDKTLDATFPSHRKAKKRVK